MSRLICVIAFFLIFGTPVMILILIVHKYNNRKQPKHIKPKHNKKQLHEKEITEGTCHECGKEVKAEHRPAWRGMPYKDVSYRSYPKRLKDFTDDDLDDLRHRR